MTKLKLNVIIIPLNYANESTSEIDPLVCKRFLHLEDPTIDLNELKERIETRCQRLYPDEDKLQIEGFQDTHLCDLDPDYCISDVFLPGDILRAIIKNQFKSRSLSISNTSLQGTPSPPLVPNSTFITGTSEFSSSRKGNIQRSQSSQHVSSARPPLKRRTTKDRIVARNKQRVSSSPSNDKTNRGSTAPDMQSIPTFSPIVSTSNPSSPNRFEQDQISQMSIGSTQNTQTIIPDTQPPMGRHVPGDKFNQIVSALPNFQYDSVMCTYHYTGSDVLLIFETIQSILLWYSNGKKSNVFNCKIQRRQCPAYIRFLNKIRPELEWHYNHSHDCVTNDYFNKLEESLNIQKYILRHYKSLKWDNLKEDYCSRLEKSKVKYFDSCNTLINLIYKSVYYRLNQDSHLEILRQFQNSQSAFLETKYKVFSKETSYGHQNWCIVLFNSRAEDGDVLHVASTDGLAIDIVPQLKQKGYDGTITLTSVISRSSVTGLESPNVLMVTNLRSDEALDYFFDTSKDYLSKARGFVIDCDFHLFDSIKKYYPSHEVRLCPLSINEILCKTWLVNGSVRLISDIEFLSRFFRSLSIMDKDQFEDEWRSIKSLFLPSRK